ncbi:MAG: 2-dehydro-3-deoxygalactonokinase [Polaromonas sp.]|nr:2-dehydro-3-deoxygalactonokinase [Polaromonas sp.]
MIPLLALDWGSSSLRGALIAPDGTVLEGRSFARGILTVDKGGFPAVFETCFGEWMQADTLCLIAGMAGSQQGWLEAPYCPCPAGFEDIAGQLVWVDHKGPGRMAIVPGLSIAHDGVPDLMRGEETQIFGALQLLGLTQAAKVTLVLPGTHSKWVTVNSNRVTDFSSWMTGEFYALLRQHSILARTLPGQEPELDAAAFDQGIKHALRSNGLLNTAFSVRTLSLFKRMGADALPSYLSGLVIGEELKSQKLQRGEQVIVMGSEALTARYEQALAHMSVSVLRAGSSATWCGLRAIANTLVTNKST